MTRTPDKKNSTLPILLFLALLANAGLLTWGWFLYQDRRASYNASGLNVASAPPPEAAPPLPEPAPLPSETAPKAGAPRPDRPAPLGAMPIVPESAASGKRRKPGRNPAPVSKAVRFYYRLLRENPRFYHSKAIREWRKDFLSYEDLRSLDAAYRQDRDALAFLAGTVASPNFRKLLRKYLASPDIQDFLKTMAGSKDVLAAGPYFLSDEKTEGTLRRLRVPGLPSFSSLAGYGRRAVSPLKTGDLKALEQDPELRKLLEGRTK